jgi:hypothetical protein
MSGGGPAQSAAAGGVATEARRRRPDRPPTVPLSEFGKEPPPPPRAKLTPRQIAIYSAATLAVLLVIWVAAVQIGNISNQYWSSAGCVDVRQCK